MFKEGNALQEPFRQAGLASLPYETAAYSAGASQIPGLVSDAFATKNGLSSAGQWNLEQAQRTNADALSARGLSNSGAALELNRRTGESVAAQDYTDAWNRKIQAASLALGQNPTGVGSSTASSMGSAATNTGSNIATTTQAGAAQQGYYTNQAGQATGNMYQNLGGLGAGLGAGLAKSISPTYSNYGNYDMTGQSNVPYEQNFAEGGRPPVGKEITVGEEGPEKIVMDHPGTVIPNPSTQRRMVGRPGAGLSGMGKDQPMKQDWMELEAMESQEIKAAIVQLDVHMRNEGPGLDYLSKRDKLQKMLAAQVQRVEKGTQPKAAATGGK
jgi:hypothetical protein